VIGFNIIYQQSIATCTYTTVVVRSAVTGQDSSKVSIVSTLKYHATDKNDTPLSHFNLTVGQPVVLLLLNSECYKLVSIFQSLTWPDQGSNHQHSTLSHWWCSYI